MRLRDALRHRGQTLQPGRLPGEPAGRARSSAIARLRGPGFQQIPPHHRAPGRGLPGRGRRSSRAEAGGGKEAMANVTTIYACAQDGLYIFNKPGTATEWLPHRQALEGRQALAAWAEPGPHVRLLVAVGVEGDQEAGELLLSESGGRSWQTSLDAPVTAILGFADNPSRLYAGMSGGGLAGSVDGGATWGVLPGIEQGGSIKQLALDFLE